MYLKLPPDYVEPYSGTPLPDAVLYITDIQTNMRANDARMQVAIFSSLEVVPDHRPVIERAEPSLSPRELDLMRPELHEALYTVLAARPEYAGAILILDEYLPFGEATSFNLFCFGHGTARGVVEGRAALAGNATLQEIKIGQLYPQPSIVDALVVGGGLTAVSAVEVVGSVVASAPPAKPPGLTVSVGTYRAAPSPVDFSAARVEIEALCDLYAAEPVNGTTSIQGTVVQLTGIDAHLNVFEIPSGTVITEMRYVVPLGSTVINIWRGSTWALGDYMTVVDNAPGKGTDSAYVLHLFSQATTLSVANKNVSGWIMAPRAAVSFGAPASGQPTAIGSGVWLWNNQTATPPPNTQLRSSTGAWADALVLNIDRQDNANADRDSILGQLRIGDLIRLEHNTDATRFARYEVRAAGSLVQGEYYSFPVRYLGGGGTLPNSGTQIKVALSAAPTPSVIGGLIAASLNAGSAATLRYVPFRGALPAEALSPRAVTTVEGQIKLRNVVPPSDGDPVDVPMRTAQQTPMLARRWWGSQP